MFVGQIAIAVAALFAGAAFYINVAEHPARMTLPAKAALAQWRPGYKRGFSMQASLAIAGFIFGAAAWWISGGWLWLTGALLMIANWPYTLIVMMPVNTRLFETSEDATGLLRQWNRLHAIRTALGIAALASFVAASLS